MKKIISTLCFFLSLNIIAQETPHGTYSGSLNLGFSKLKLRININPEGSSLDSPDQGACGIALDTDYLSADSVAFSCKSLQAKYCAIVKGDTLEGKFSQRGLGFKLNLIKQTEGIQRPQTPKPPFPYESIDTVFSNPRAGITLAGTLVIPNGATKKKPVPAVVFVSGSGAQNRDEELFDHKPFYVIADYLARNGIASLRYDDRGYAQSGGDLASATTADFADDALAAVEFLRSCEGIGKVGIIGHSEGGTIAFMVAAEHRIPYIVSLAGAIIPCKEILLEQNRRSLAKARMTDARISETLRLLDAAFDNMASGKTVDIKTLATDLNIDLPEQVIDMLAKNTSKQTPWFNYFVGLRPLDYITKVNSSILALGGDRDTQVSASTNLEALKKVKNDAVTRIYPGLNHMFQHCQTGEVAEYSEISETISPEVLTDIVDFINANK